MQTNKAKTTSDAYGRKINVKYIYLGSIFRQFVLSRANVNYVHYIWPMCSILTALGFIVLLLQVCYCVLRNTVCCRVVRWWFPRKNMFIFSLYLVVLYVKAIEYNVFV